MKTKRTLCFIYGTRPEIIKLSPLIRLCMEKKIPFFSIHTGQHYSYSMNDIFLKELGLPRPEYNLCIRSTAAYKQGKHTGRMLIKIEKILLDRMPYCVVVEGDTNTVLAGVLAAEKITTTKSFTGFDIKVAHVEAGLRSFDHTMPEECNRFIADHLSDFLFAPTALEKNILLKEGVPPDRIHVVGNTIVDVVKNFTPRAKESNILKKLGLAANSYILLTLHRQEGVDSKKTLESIFMGVTKTARDLKLPVIFPIHPRTVRMLKHFNLKMTEAIRVINPVGFLDFLKLESNAALIMTDSGGVQEEACIYKVPCVTLRKNTERPETISVGSNIIAGIRPDDIARSAARMFASERRWKNPFGDGRASGRILKEILS